VVDLCKDADDVAGVKGAVYQCLISNSEDLDPGCKKELGRAVHMAMFIWTSNQLLTSVCDDEVQNVCVAKRPSLPQTTGAVLNCLSDAVSFMTVLQRTCH
jgi:Golgi apparatus protein 1